MSLNEGRFLNFLFALSCLPCSARKCALTLKFVRTVRSVRYSTYSTYSTYRRALDLRIVGILDNFVTGTSVVPETSIAQRTSRLCSSFNKLQNDDIQ